MHMRKTLLILLLIILMALAFAGSAFAQDGDGDPEHGADLYAENCVACHGEQGEGRATSLESRVFTSIAPNAFMTDVISNGIDGTFMIPWSTASGGPLTEAEIQDIIAYINTWGTASEPPLPAPQRPPVEIEPVPEVDGDPNEGYVVYQTNCVVCHGEFLEGRTGATLSTAFAAINPGAFAIGTISRGIENTLMPAWSTANGGPLNEQEINDVAAYVLSVQQPEQPVPQPEVEPQSGGLLLGILGGVLALLIIMGVLVSSQQRKRSAAE
jgi:mono/diheme cytochrome c family protein